MAKYRNNGNQCQPKEIINIERKCKEKAAANWHERKKTESVA
jgi:hypothetical protein